MSAKKDWARESFRGLQNVTVPSFNADFTALSEAGVRHDVRRSVEHGFFATLCACDAGLTMDENRQFVSWVAEEAGDELMVGVSLFLDNESDMVELARHAERSGADFALLGFPLLFDPQNDDDVYRYARRICEASGLAIVLPAHPERVDMSHLDPHGVPMDAYQRIAEIDNVVALLVQSSEPGLISDCFQRFGERLLVSASFLGSLPMLMKSWGLQWSGDFMYEALQAPGQTYAVDFFRMLTERRFDDALALFWRLSPGLAVLGHVQSQFDTGGIDHFHLRKYLQWCVGGNGGLTREPQMNLMQRQRDEIRHAFQAMGITPTASDDEKFMLGRANDSASMD